MLGSDGEFAKPKEPGYYVNKDSFAETSKSSQSEKSITNKMTITLLEARWKKDQMEDKVANIFGHMICVASTIHVEGVSDTC
jgi:hypothetical protein